MAKKIILSLLVFLFTFLKGVAGTYELVDVKPVKTLALNTLLNVSDPASYIDATIAASDISLKREAVARLYFGRQSHSDIVASPPAWTFVRIKYKLTHQVSGVTDPEQTLTIQYNGSDEKTEENKIHITTDGSVELKVTALEAYDGGGFAMSTLTLPDDIHLELKLVTDKYYKLAASPSELTFNATTPGAGKIIDIKWDVIFGAESYDLEWVFYDKYYEYITWLNAGVQGVAFGDKTPVRINTSDNHYRLINTYPEGYLGFRVRPVGRSVQTGELMVGNWISRAVGGDMVAVTCAASDLDSKTWSLTKTYAEEGKSKEAITYYDETNRSRQTLTHSSTNHTTLLAETKYDHEGRPVVNTLPYPYGVSGSSIPSEVNLLYHPNISLNTGSSVFSKKDFDQWPGTSHALSGASSPEAYYNRMFNPDPYAQNMDYLPSAEGYAYTQVKYKKDNTGKPEAQSGIGVDHKLSSGHETRYFYSTPDQSMLMYLFGDNVGNATHYQKIATQDPNGQVSVTYLDQADRVIATGLTGETPANVQELDGFTPASFTSNLLVNNQYDDENHQMISNYKIINTVPGEIYHFNYDLTNLSTQIATSSCPTCKYSLILSVTDPQGAEMTLPLTPSGTTLPKTYVLNNCNETASNDPVSFDLTLTEIGEYTVTKTLKYIEPDINVIRDNLVAANQALKTSLISIQKNRYWKDALCNQTCEDMCVGSTDVDCVLKCKEDHAKAVAGNLADDECEGYKARMIAQLSPGGYYYEAWKNQVASDCGQGYSNCIYNAFLVNFGTVGSVNGLQYLDELHFKSEWAEAMLQYHPEYCHLQLCNALKLSTAFDKKMAIMHTVSDADRLICSGCSSNIISNLLAKDPFSDFLSLFQVPVLFEYPITEPLPVSTSPLISKLINPTPNKFWQAYINHFGDANAVNLWDYFDPISNDDLNVKYLYLGINPANTYAIEERRWTNFRGRYLDLKQKAIDAVLRTNYCNLAVCSDPFTHYLTKPPNNENYDHTVFEYSKPRDIIAYNSTGVADIPQTLANAADYLQGAFTEECQSYCPENVDKWMYSLVSMPPLDVSSSATFPQTLTFGDMAEPGSMSTSCRSDVFGQLFTTTPATYMPSPLDFMPATFLITKKPAYDNVRIELSNYCMDKCATAGASDIHIPGYITDFYRIQNDELVDAIPALTSTVVNNCLKPSPNCQKRVDFWQDQMIKHCQGLNTSSATLREKLEDLCAATTNIFDDQFELTTKNIREILTATPSPTPGTDKYIAKQAVLDIEALLNSHTCSLFDNLVGEGYEPYCILDHCLVSMLQSADFSSVPHSDEYTMTQLSSAPCAEYTPLGGGTSGGHSSRVAGPLESDEDPYPLTSPSSACNLLRFYDACGNPVPLSAIKEIKDIYPGKGAPFVELPSCGLKYSGVDVMVTLSYDELYTGDYNTYDCYHPLNILRYPEGSTTINNTADPIPQFITINLFLFQPKTGGCIADFIKCDDKAQEAKNQCLKFVNDAAEFWGEKQFEEAMDIKVQEYLKDLRDKCFEKIPAEKYTVEYNMYEHHFTLWYYDQAGNLVQTVPPEGFSPPTQAKLAQMVDTRTANPKSSSFSYTYADQPDHYLLTNYQYNSTNQAVWQNTPDANQTRYWYNNKGQLRFSQNAKQALTAGTYSISMYDKLGRVYSTSEIVTPLITANDLKAEVPSALINKNYPDNCIAGYCPTSVKDAVLTMYDASLTSPCGQPTQNNRGRVSSVATMNVPSGGSPTLQNVSYYSYDIHGNVKTLYQDIAGLGCKRIDYNYDLLSGKVNRVDYQAGMTDEFHHRYEYDADNRLTNAYTSTDNRIWEQDARYFYYPHGPLARVELGHDRLQGLDYYYTIHGWLKGVNMPGTQKYDHTITPAGTLTTDPGKDGYVGSSNLNQFFGPDEFSMQLGYYKGDYLPKTGTDAYTNMATLNLIPSLSASILGSTAQKGLFNGNIAAMATEVPELKRKISQSDLTVANAYQYDQLNRIKESNFYPMTSSNNWGSASSVYHTDYSYDANGNIKTLKRFDQGADKFDDLGYNYTYTGTRLQHNKLDFVTDGGTTTQIGDIKTGQATGNYDYDETGNLVNDDFEANSITWNAKGKISQVISGVLKYTYDYDAMGNRVRKRSTTNIALGPVQHDLFYVRDASGNIMATYDKSFFYNPTNPNMSPVITLSADYPLYGSSRLGIYSRNQIAMVPSIDLTAMPSYSRMLGKRQYELNDHLGNVMATFYDSRKGADIAGSDGKADIYYASMHTAQDYYPFGMIMPGRSYSTMAYRFGFNGKEKDDEISGSGNQYDYGMRIYNPRIARFLSVDPLTKNYPSWSPYPFAMNRPIDGIDLDGEEWISKHKWNDVITNEAQIKVLTAVGVYKSEMSYHEAWSAFSPIIFKKYENEQIVEDCADLAYSAIIDFAAKFELPIYFRGNRKENVDIRFDNDLMKYDTKEDLTIAVKNAFSASDLAADYPDNKFRHTIKKDFNDIETGDLISWKSNQRYHHTQTVTRLELSSVIIASKNSNNLVKTFYKILDKIVSQEKETFGKVIVTEGNISGSGIKSQARSKQMDFSDVQKGKNSKGEQENTRLSEWNFNSFDNKGK